MTARSASTRGISPVIGTVLLVGIVVILSATIGVYLLGFSDQEPVQAPQTAIVADYSDRIDANGEYLNLTFDSGEPLYRSNLSIVMTDAKSSDGSDVALTANPIQAQAPTRITAGVTVSIHAGHFTAIGSGEQLDLSDARLRLVWQPAPNEDVESYVIYRWPAPSKR